jgi:hypothetical protein
MTSLLTFKTRREALELAEVFLQDNPAGSWEITPLPDGRFRLDLQDSPQRQPVA